MEDREEIRDSISPLWKILVPLLGINLTKNTFSEKINAATVIPVPQTLRCMCRDTERALMGLN